MARIKLLSNEELHESLNWIPEGEKNGKGDNLMRVIANNTRVANCMHHFFAGAMKESTLPLQTVEYLIVFITKQRDCEYCLSAHVPLALSTGITEEQIANMNKFESCPNLYPKEIVPIFHLAKTCLAASQNIQDSHIAALKEFYSDSDIVEIIAIICAVFSTTSFNNALGIDLSPDLEETFNKYKPIILDTEHAN